METRQREPRIEMPKLLAHAKDQDCTIRHPAHCTGTGVVAAHYNWIDGGKGKGLKATDSHIAFACSGCHAFVDNPAAASVDERKLWWLRGHLQTLYILIRDKVLK